MIVFYDKYSTTLVSALSVTEKGVGAEVVLASIPQNFADIANAEAWSYYPYIFLTFSNGNTEKVYRCEPYYDQDTGAALNTKFVIWEAVTESWPIGTKVECRVNSDSLMHLQSRSFSIETDINNIESFIVTSVDSSYSNKSNNAPLLECAKWHDSSITGIGNLPSFWIKKLNYNINAGVSTVYIVLDTGSISIRNNTGSQLQILPDPAVTVLTDFEGLTINNNQVLELSLSKNMYGHVKVLSSSVF